jgi:hypothetical protein
MQAVTSSQPPCRYLACTTHRPETEKQSVTQSLSNTRTKLILSITVYQLFSNCLVSITKRNDGWTENKCSGEDARTFIAAAARFLSTSTARSDRSYANRSINHTLRGERVDIEHCCGSETVIGVGRVETLISQSLMAR